MDKNLHLSLSQPQSYPGSQLSHVSHVTDEVLDFVSSKDGVKSAAVKNLQDHVMKLSKMVAELKETVHKQQISINLLITKLSKAPAVNADAVDDTVSILAIPGSSGSSSPPVATDGAKSYAAAVGLTVSGLQPVAKPTLTSSVRRAVLTAVHSEMRVKQLIT